MAMRLPIFENIELWGSHKYYHKRAEISIKIFIVVTVRRVKIIFWALRETHERAGLVLK